MKVKSATLKNTFQPFTVSVTFESAEEVEALLKVLQSPHEDAIAARSKYRDIYELGGAVAAGIGKSF